MSLINKMLQDLDARGGAPKGAGLSDSVQAVQQRSSRNHVVLIAAAAAIVVVSVAGFAGWRYLRNAPADAVPAPATGVIRQATVAEKPQATPPEQMVDGLQLPAANEAAAPAPPAAGAREGAEAGAPALAKPPGASLVKRDDSGAASKAPVRRREGAGPAAVPSPLRAAANAGGAVSPASRETGAQASATALFQRAQGKLASGRVAEAIVDLEAALDIDQRYLAARETLVGVLVESGQQADAMRHLRRALALNPEQSGMAMLLARLQLEHGSGALDTLEQSLPYAQSNPDYRAMMAGVLERAGRHREAALHYQAAVQLQPANGVWWMGLGIALQGDKRNAEAKPAFQRALDSGRLSPELQAFVERRLQQLN
ncbi:tetratricopeptide repeat protein [Pseudoduganella sp. R-32]|uniref:tetratricopeptide repeat protein n=1 Tax=Pseudoduganella sp. R-32 TaxID=3404061 RepID=UPI003CEC4B7F